MPGKRQLHMTKPFCSAKSCGFQAAKEMNDGMYVCFTMSCPDDALGDRNINRWRALPAFAKTWHQSYSSQVNFLSHMSQMDGFFEFCVAK